MKLQILVPQYRETDEVIKPLLDSIAIQQSIDMQDVGVIICNDGSDVLLSNGLIGSYPYSIEYYKEPHKGVSATRNASQDAYMTDDKVWYPERNTSAWESLIDNNVWKPGIYMVGM